MSSFGPQYSPAVPVVLIFNLKSLTVQTPEEVLGQCCPVGGHFRWPTWVFIRD